MRLVQNYAIYYTTFYTVIDSKRFAVYYSKNESFTYGHLALTVCKKSCNFYRDHILTFQFF